MTAEAPDLSLESERARILSEARLIVDRLSRYTVLIAQWNALEEGREDAKH